MLVYEYKLKVSTAQCAAIGEALRLAQCMRNKCLRLWMDESRIGANDLQIYCSRLAHTFDFAARLDTPADSARSAAPW
jgi:putative transposase